MNGIANFAFGLSIILVGLSFTGLIRKFNLVDKFVFGGVIGLAVVTLINFFSGYLIGLSPAGILTVSLLISLVGIWFRPSIHLKVKLSLPILIYFIAWAFFLGIVWSRVFVIRPEGIYSSCQNCYGDWAVHLTYTSSFAYADNWPPQLPMLAGHPLTYPFLIDYLSAVLITLGWGLSSAMLIPGWLLSLAFVYGLFRLGQAVTGSLFVGILSPLLYLFNGGIGFLFKNSADWFTHIPEKNIVWINFIKAQLLPQRGWVWGMALSLIIYIGLWRFSKNSRGGWRWGLIGAALPLIHMHSFLAIAFIAGCLAIRELIHRPNREILIKWGRFFFPLLLFGGLQIITVYGLINTEHYFQILPGWLAGAENYLWFWVKNVGAILIIGIGGWFFLPDKLRSYGAAFWWLFVLSNLVQFQPYNWDNIKFFNHWYVVVVITAGYCFWRLAKTGFWGNLLSFGVIVFSLYAGVNDTAKIIDFKNNRYLFFGREALSLAQTANMEVEPKAVLVVAGTHDHWLPVFTGRKLVLGYPVWLDAYGIDYTQRQTDVKNLYRGGMEATRLIKKYEIDYVLIGPTERGFYPGLDESFFDSNFTAILLPNKTKIYRMNVLK